MRGNKLGKYFRLATPHNQLSGAAICHRHVGEINKTEVSARVGAITSFLMRPNVTEHTVPATLIGNPGKDL